MPATSIQSILDSLPQINTKRKYWFFRTNGGVYYNAFIKGNYIAIDYNRISLSDIKAGNTQNEIGIKILAQRIAKKYTEEEEKRPTHAANQLLKFTYQMKRGDIVLIPSENSLVIGIGEIKETPVFLANPNENDPSPYVKRKSVKWLKSIQRFDLDPNLYKLMYSHHTVTEADSYSESIDKIINSFYIKGEKANLVLDVKATEDIKAKDLFEMGSICLEFLDEFCEEENLPYSSESVNVKLDVQSPGFIILSGITMPSVVLVGLIIVFVAGGGFYYTDSKGVKIGLKTDGIIEKIGQFLNRKSNRETKRKLLEKHLENLQIEDPKDLIKVLKELENK